MCWSFYFRLRQVSLCLDPSPQSAFTRLAAGGSRALIPRGGGVFSLLRGRSAGSILALGALLTVIFLVWMGTAETIYKMLFGEAPVSSLSAFVHQVFETPEGERLMIVGTGIGFVFALLTFAISVVSSGVVHTECEQSVSASPCEGASEACGAISIQNADVIGVYQHQGAVRRQNRGELDHGSSFIRRHAAAEDNRCGPDRSCTALRHNHVRSP